MNLYSYIVKHDTGFAPNPFFGYCTLACCKPVIRRCASVGDWIVGLTPKAQGNRIVYAIHVDEILNFYDYWNDRRFRQKKPRNGKNIRLRCGDNIYEPLPNGRYRQLQSMHSDKERENSKNKVSDLSGKRVLISRKFVYFGSQPIPLPPELNMLAVCRGHRCRFPDKVRTAFILFIGKQKLGIHAPPEKWSKNDNSWKAASCSR